MLVDFGTLGMLHDLDIGKLSVRELGEQVFLCDPEGPRLGQWGYWVVLISALARSLAPRFGHQPYRHGPLH